MNYKVGLINPNGGLSMKCKVELINPNGGISVATLQLQEGEVINLDTLKKSLPSGYHFLTFWLE
jgi:hypothetical protein